MDRVTDGKDLAEATTTALEALSLLERVPRTENALLLGAVLRSMAALQAALATLVPDKIEAKEMGG